VAELCVSATSSYDVICFIGTRGYVGKHAVGSTVALERSGLFAQKPVSINTTTEK